MKKAILVTGAHRSGSTWIGKIITKADGVRYVSEPFNVLDYKYSPIKHWFYFIHNSSSEVDKKAVQKYIDSFFNYSFQSIYRDFSKVRSLKTLRRVIGDYKTRNTHRTLLKDPIAFFSSEWIFENYSCDVIVSIRHPAAFIASLKVKNWQFDFNNFLNQPLLMNTHLVDFRDDIEKYALNRPDIIRQGILLWNIIYSLAYKYQEKYGNQWYFITHEALSLHPVQEFEKMFNYLKLDFSDRVRNELVETTTSNENSKLKRNAKENVLEWKNRLTEEEIELIKKQTQPIWVKFYNENSWG